jgi:hypothetical protein
MGGPVHLTTVSVMIPLTVGSRLNIDQPKDDANDATVAVDRVRPAAARAGRLRNDYWQ